MRKLLRPCEVSFALLLIVTLAASPSAAATIHVPADQPTIQAGIDAAAAGDTVLVARGTYMGMGNRDVDFGGRSLVLRSEGGPGATLVNCNASEASQHRAFILQASEAATIEGFTIQNGVHSGGGAIYLYGVTGAIRNCVFIGNRTPGLGHGGAIDCQTGGEVEITDCRFEQNQTFYSGGAIAFQGGCLVVTNCVFEDNHVFEWGAAISVFPFGELLVRDSFFRGNESDDAAGTVAIRGGDITARIENCIFFQNLTRAVFIEYNTGTEITGCTMAGNPLGISVYDGSVRLQNSIIAFSEGRAISCVRATVTAACSDIYGNAGGDWIDCLAGEEGTDGNFAVDPRFCEPIAGDLGLFGDSPCLPGQHPDGADCGLIGALSVGCGATATKPTTWGSLKARFE